MINKYQIRLIEDSNWKSMISNNDKNKDFPNESSNKIHLPMEEKGFNLWNLNSLNNLMFSRESNQKTKKTSKPFPTNNISNVNKNTKSGDVVSVTYEEIGLWPRSFSRVLDRFLKQVFSDVENLVIQEYRFYRYLFLTTVRCLLILFFVPFLVNFFAKNYLIHPLTEYFWNTKQSEIFLNLYQQKHAFAELKEFEEKLYFESFIPSHKTIGLSDLIEKTSLKDSPMLSNSGSTNTSTILVDSPIESNSLEAFPMLSNTNSFGLTQMNTSFSSSDGKIVSQKNSNDKEKVYTDSVSSNKIDVIKDYNEANLRASSSSSIPLNVGTQPPKDLEGNFNETLWKNEENIKETNKKMPYFVKENIYNSERNLYKQKLQEKTIEIATRYNEQSIEVITNLFADLLSFLTFFYLLFHLEIQINITKSFLLEVFFGLEDSKKSLFILLVTDLLVGYHSSNIWELFFEFLFHHYGLPESQTGIFLLVATLPVLLDVLFKYLIFRHLNRSSPATVATYHAMIE